MEAHQNMATHAIKIENGKFTQGELSFDIDVKDLAKALQQVDKLSVAQHRELAKLNGITVEPFDRRLLRPVVLGLVQSAWYKAIKGSIPEKVAASQSNRLVEYARQLEALKNVSEEDIVATRSRKSSKAASDATPKAVLKYVLAEDKVTAILAKDVKERGDQRLIGQQYMIVEALRKLKVASSVDDITKAIVANPYVITPGKTNVSFHINDFKKAGLVTAVDEKGQVVVDAPKAKGGEKPPSTKEKEDAKAASEKKPAKK